jgi:hypothetical protein
MKTKILTGTLLMSSALAMAALAPATASARTLRPGDYSLGGIQSICLKKNGTWYGESFGPWSGQWKAGPTREDSTLIYGNYASGAGNDTLVVSGGGSTDWNEWRDDLSFQNFLEITVTRTSGTCSAPAARVTTHKNPMD